MSKIIVILFVFIGFTSYAKDTLYIKECVILWKLNSCELDSNQFSTIDCYMECNDLGGQRINISYTERIHKDASFSLTKCRLESLCKYLEDHYDVRIESKFYDTKVLSGNEPKSDMYSEKVRVLYFTW